MNPHAAQPTSLPALARSFWRSHQLIAQLNEHEMVGVLQKICNRFRQSFFNPVFMLTMYATGIEWFIQYELQLSIKNGVDVARTQAGVLQ